MNEAEMAGLVMEWLEGAGWDCYPEAQIHTGGRRADIAAVQDSRLWLLEAKKSATLSLLDQATDWNGTAHIISVIVPYGRTTRAFLRYCKMMGIGVIRVRRAQTLYHGEPEARSYGGIIDIEINPRLNRKAHPNAHRFINNLHEDMKRYRPGSTSVQGYSTPWSRTMKACRDFISENPGCSLKEIIKAVDHHYASDPSAMSSLRHWLERDYLIDVRIHRNPRKMFLYFPSESNESLCN